MTGGATIARKTRRPGLLTFVRWEWTLQKRTFRFWIGLLVYEILVLLPALAIHFLGERYFGVRTGPTTYLVWTLQIQTFLSVLLGCIWAGNRSGSVAGEELWPVLSASPLSNAGFALRRTAAIAVLLLPATALATAAAAVVAHLSGATPGPEHWLQWLATWLLAVYLPAVLFAAAWRTLVRATGGEMLAALSTLLLVQAFGFLRSRTSHFLGWPLGLDDASFGLRGFQWATYLLVQMQESRGRFGIFGGPASEAPFDLPAAVGQWWRVSGVTLGVALALGLLVPLWMGRTRRDLPPLRLSEEHWLRTIGPRVYGFLQRMVPDAGLRELKWLVAAVVGLGVFLVVDDWRRFAHARDLAARRYAAETAGGELEPTDVELRLMEWRSAGDVSTHGVDLRWRSELRLPPGAAEPVDRVLFLLDPFLDVSDLQIESEPPSPRSVVEQRRDWDRWTVRFEPPLEAGETLRVAARLTGVPGDFEFDLRVRGGDVASFVTRFQNYLEHKTAWQESDLSLVHFEPAVSPRRVNLAARSLGGVPRYTTLQLSAPPVLPFDRGNEVPPEAASTRARVHLDLTVSAGHGSAGPLDASGGGPLVVASSCGGVAVPASAGVGHAADSRLVEHCEADVHELRVRGGRWRSRSDGPVTVASLPRHLERLATGLPEMKTVIAASGRAWPGFDGVERLAVIEAAGPYDLYGRDLILSDGSWMRPWANGRMVAYGEALVAGSFPLDPTAVLDSVLTAELTAGRNIDVEQRGAMRTFFSALMKRRMGVGRQSAVVGKGLKPWEQSQLHTSLAQARHWHQIFLADKVPALVIELERRVGRERLVAAVAEFLAEGDGAEDGEAATFADLFDAIERSTGESLDTFVADFVDGGALPRLQLADTRSVQGRAGWRVEGSVVNKGGGEVHCPVVVRTEGTEVRDTYVVPSAGRVDFAFELASRPQFVVLDPEGLCLRLFGGAGANVERINLIR